MGIPHHGFYGPTGCTWVARLSGHHLTASRTSLHAGRVIVQLWNRGQDPHDLRIRSLDRRGRMTRRAQGLGVTVSGGDRS